MGGEVSCLDDRAATIEMLAFNVLPHAPTIVLSVVASHDAAVIIAAASSMETPAPASARTTAERAAAPPPPEATATSAAETHFIFAESLGGY